MSDGLTRAQVEIVKELTVDVERLQAKNERLRAALRSLHWHTVENTVNKSIFIDIIETALK